MLLQEAPAESVTLQNTRKLLDSVGVTDKTSLVNFLARAGTIGQDGSEPLSLADLINRAKIKLGENLPSQQPDLYSQQGQSVSTFEGHENYQQRSKQMVK